jgi:hypothetical protein
VRRWKAAYYVAGFGAILLAFVVLHPIFRDFRDASPGLRTALVVALVLAVGALVISYLVPRRHLRRWWCF